MPVYVDSPLASRATEVYRKHREAFDEEAWKLVDEPGGIFDFPQLHYTQSADESRALNGKRGVVIISASGMADAGRVRHHLKHNLWRPEAHVVIVGFQAQGTLGRRLLDGDKRVRIFGEEIAVKAHIDEITGLSAHADQEQLLDLGVALRAAAVDHPHPRRAAVGSDARAAAGGEAALQGGRGRAERDLRPRWRAGRRAAEALDCWEALMRAMLLEAAGGPLRSAEVPGAEPGPGQVRVKVQACGVCRTDLHIVDGELPMRKRPLILGHQIVGVVDKAGSDVTAPVVGDLVGIPWLGWTDGTCRYCLSGRENLCDHAKFTGYDIDGGFAEYAVADHRFAFPIPAGYPVAQAAPLLCAGLIGYRSLSHDRARRSAWACTATARPRTSSPRWLATKAAGSSRSPGRVTRPPRSSPGRWVRSGPATPPAPRSGGARRRHHLRSRRRAGARWL